AVACVRFHVFVLSEERDTVIKPTLNTN
ncbi:hypothetical protein D047_0385B, partial [Vibrio parahaemolyticus VPTS-2010_2]